ncbi:MAG: sensor histidine kinase [Crocinitomicaceae bacterium]|nr:sensor histidine kinase [Crocinitomicaceae bacterium]
MTTPKNLPEYNKFTLAFKDKELEKEFTASYDDSVKIPLRFGIIISILSWYSAIWLIYSIIPQEFNWLALLTVVYIGSYFGFIVYATYVNRFKGYYHLLGAISNAWAGLYVIYFCDQFPTGEHLMLPVLIFIIFFGSYMVRLRWLAGFIAALSYTIAYHIYIETYADISASQVLLYAFVAWMTLVFAILAGRVTEEKNRISFIQRKTIEEQSAIIEGEKELLLTEVHHRVKNNLQIIVSLINLQLSKFDNAEIAVALKETQSRVMAMSLVHQRMKQTSSIANISLHDYTHQMIDNIYQLNDGNDALFELEISEELVVDIETAIPLGLIINEIVSNFFKHCASKDDTARAFTIQASKSAKDECLIKYSDNGVGFPPNTSTENDTTLGLELIQSLTDQIDGEFKFYSENGACYELKFTL